MKKYNFGAVLIANQIMLNLIGLIFFFVFKEMSSIYLCFVINIGLLFTLFFELEDLKEKSIRLNKIFKD
jgi:hypothetical protein